MSRLYWLPVVVAAIGVGCQFESFTATFPEPESEGPPPSSGAAAFDPAKCGRIAGQVTWNGPHPSTPPFLYGVPKAAGNFEVVLKPNPNRPAIDERTQAVAGAVVFLRGVSPRAAKPWDRAPVRIEMHDRGIRIRQGGSERHRVGFVRRGDSVAMVSAEPVHHVLRGRGAAFFSLAFPDPDRPLSRAFDKAGRIELSSGAGYYWASADLFVADHPYFALTDREGRFALEQVPAGPVDVVAWLPGWDVVKQERDPESGLIVRQTYAAPVEAVRKLAVEAGASAEVNIRISR